MKKAIKDTTRRAPRKLITADGVAIKSMQLYLPKDGTYYRARKTQQLLHIFDAQLLNDCTKVNIKDYLMVLKEYTDLTTIISQKGRANAISKKAKQGVDETGLDETNTDKSEENVFSD